MMEEDHQRFLKADLPYELDALERAFLVVTSNELANFRATPALANLFIENFWLHARNLTEFFETDKNSSTVSPFEFTNDTYRKPKTLKPQRDFINAQITHLQIARRESDKQNLASQMQNVLGAIRKATREFEASLCEGSKKFWRKHETMTVADVIAHLASGSNLLEQANTTTHVPRYGIDYLPITGPAAPVR
jgi:hypothetical protein